MKVSISLLTQAGIVEVRNGLTLELSKKFVTPVRCYQAAANLVKAAKQTQDSFLTKDVLKALVEQHKDAVEEHRYFDHDGVRCFIKERVTYKYDGDEQYKVLLRRYNNAKAKLDRHKAKMVEAGTAVPESVDFTFEARGEAKM